MPMSHAEALKVVASHRADKVVVTTMTSGGVWPSLSDTGLDFTYLPSSMGQGPALALGLALAQKRGVIVVNGDGCTLMNLGCLFPLASNPADVFLIVMDNGLYEVTGGQPHAGVGIVDFATIARGAGIRRVYAFANLEEWSAGAREALTGAGPVVVWLKITGRVGQKTPKPPRPMSEQIARLRAALEPGVRQG